MGQRLRYLLAVMVLAMCMLSGCGATSSEVPKQGPADDIESTSRESEYYTMAYDSSIFDKTSTVNSDIYSYITEESLPVPVMITVTEYADKDAKTIADEMLQSSGEKDATVQDTVMGAESLNVKLVYVEKDNNDVKAIEYYYAIPMETGSLLIKVVSYVGAPEEVDQKIEEMMATFKLK